MHHGLRGDGRSPLVTCLSNFVTISPVIMVEQHVHASPSKTKATYPRMISNCTTRMGGVGLLYHLLLVYKPKLKGEK